MADLEEITETPRTGTGDDSNDGEERESTRQSSIKRKRSKKRRSSDRSQSPAQLPPPDEVFEEGRKKDENGEQKVMQQAESTKQDAIPTQEDHRDKFYQDYRKVAEEYDKEFLKKHDEDLNTTLIFAGLFSAVTSAFIIQVDSQIQPDPNDETASLLRVLLYKIDNTTFGGNIPALPQWTGPPRTMVQVQAILYSTLVISLFSAFLAMLGKQWLNRYESTDMRGSAIERSHSRQQKLGGVVAWYFDHLMESLPLMLQAALFLLGCALTRYLWEIDITIALVVLSVTSLGVTFYLFIVIAGTASEWCPYQTPFAHIFRHIFHHLREHLLPILRSAPSVTSIVVSSNFSRLFQVSWCCRWLLSWWTSMRRPWYSISNLTNTLWFPVLMSLALAHDVYYLGRVIVQPLVRFSRASYQQLMGSRRTAYRWLTNISIRTLGLHEQTTMTDLQCISWILQTSLDKAVHLSALKHLTSMPDLSHLHPTLVVDCFNIFIGCININNGKAVITQGLEQLATVSADGFFRTLHHLAITDPTSSILAHVQRRYNDIFPSEVDFTGLPFYFTMSKIHALAGRFGNPRDIQWYHPRMSIQEHIPFARRMAETAQEKYRQARRRKVPRWILRCGLYFLSLAHLSPASVVADCLTIIAIDLGCDFSNTPTSDESTRVDRVSDLIIQKLLTMSTSNLVISKRKAINTLFPYAIFLEQSGQQGMINAILHAARVSDSRSSNHGKFMWHHAVLYISRLFEKRSPTSLNLLITRISPHVPWGGALNNTIAVSRWAAAASAIPYTEEVGRSVVDVLFQISYIDFLRPHIPIEMWEWVKRRPPLPPMYHGLSDGARAPTVAYVRRLGDVDLLKSYLLTIWTDQWIFHYDQIHEVESSIREDFDGIEMAHHRKDLVERLDHVLGQLGRVEETPWVREAKAQYTGLKDALLEVDRR